MTGQKVWTTWAHLADFGVLLARTDPDVPKRQGITYFLLDLHQPGVDVRPLRHITGEVDFNEVFLDRAVVPDEQRVGEVGDGWKVANATLSGERQMVSGAGSGGVDRIGGRGVDHVIDARARDAARTAIRSCARSSMRLYSEERIRDWTNQRVRAGVKAGRSPGPGELGRQGAPGRPQPAHPAARSRSARRRRDGVGDGDAADGPPEVRGMLRSRANTIEGGTTEVNKNILGERVLGLPREPDPYQRAWRDRGAMTPRLSPEPRSARTSTSA